MQSAGDAALVAQLTAAVKTDTTDFALGHKDFRRYTTPGFCLAAVQHQRTVARRSIAAQEAADTMRRHAAQDTLPAAVAAVARACAAHFSIASTPEPELPHLFQLALMARQDTLARAVLARQLSLATPPAKAALLVEAESTYLAASPARVTAAEALVAQLDALGASAAVLPSRIQAHARLMAYGDMTADPARIRQEAAQVLTLIRSQPVNQNTELLVQVYHTLAQLVYLRAPDSLRALAQQLQHDAKQISNLKQYATMSLDALTRDLSPARYLMQQAGRPLPPVHADFWFPTIDTVVPARGRPSLVVRLPLSCYGSYAQPYVLDPIHTGCQGVYEQLRKWHAQYGAGLDLTLVAVTPSHGGTVLSGLQTPAEAAKNLDWFFRQYLKLPVQHLAVQVISLSAPLPAPDGRAFYVDSVNSGTKRATTPEESGVMQGEGSVTLTDRNGIAVYGTSAVRPVYEGVYDGSRTVDISSELDPLLAAVTAAPVPVPARALGATPSASTAAALPPAPHPSSGP